MRGRKLLSTAMAESSCRFSEEDREQVREGTRGTGAEEAMEKQKRGGTVIGVGDEVKQRWSPARWVEGGGLRAGARAEGWIEEGMDPEKDLVEWRRRWDNPPIN